MLVLPLATVIPGFVSGEKNHAKFFLDYNEHLEDDFRRLDPDFEDDDESEVSPSRRKSEFDASIARIRLMLEKVERSRRIFLAHNLKASADRHWKASKFLCKQSIG